MQIILYQPQIPQNTGNIVRTCACIGASLRLIPPLGFSTSDKQLRRAGLDYWLGVDVQDVEDVEQLLEERECYFFSSKGEQCYTKVRYPRDAALVFGSETEGLPEWMWKRWPERFVTLPMVPGPRCLNLSNAVAVAAYEVGRQHQFDWSEA